MRPVLCFRNPDAGCRTPRSESAATQHKLRQWLASRGLRRAPPARKSTPLSKIKNTPRQTLQDWLALAPRCAMSATHAMSARRTTHSALLGPALAAPATRPWTMADGAPRRRPDTACLANLRSWCRSRRRFADQALVVLGRVDQIAVLVEFDLVGRHHPWIHAVVPVHGRHDLALGPLPRARLALDRIAHAETQRLKLLRGALFRDTARLESRFEPFFVEVLPNENELALALVCVLHGNDALHAVDVGALAHEQILDPILKLIHVHVALVLDGQAAHRGVVLVLAVRVEEVGLLLQRALEVEAAHVQDVLDGHLGLAAALDGRELVHCT